MVGNATSCETSFMGNIPVSLGGASPGFVMDITPPGIGVYTYTIKCTNNEGTTIQSATVNVANQCKGNPPQPKTKRKFLFFEF
jgi:hypothetical protein